MEMCKYAFISPLCVPVFSNDLKIQINGWVLIFGDHRYKSSFIGNSSTHDYEISQ